MTTSPRVFLLASPLLFWSACSVAACGGDVSNPFDATQEAESPPAPPKELEAPSQAPPRAPPRAPAEPLPDNHAEVVYLFMTARDGGRWFCTATLLSPVKVISAAHCLDPDKFTAYQVVAPRAPGSPSAYASNPRIFGGPFSDVGNPDVGLLTLQTPIQLPVYAKLTDVVARVEGGEAITAGAVVRSAAKLFAPLVESEHVAVSSTVALGYKHGFGTPMFTKGGDSGAGLFLVVGGRLTHDLIGVARQPDPARNMDHFTRIDAAFLAWAAD